MRRKIKKLRQLAKLYFRSPTDFRWFYSSYRSWQSVASPCWEAKLEDLFPVTRDRFDNAGYACGHYFLQDLWAAQKVASIRPVQHIDIGSSVSGFVAHVASFLPVEYVDIRPLDCNVPNICWKEGSILNLPYEDESVPSMSCLHVIEHIGLGRYGDPIDPDGWIKGLREMQRTIMSGGNLFIGTPCGKPGVKFNAHRVFSPRHIINSMEDLHLVEYSLITDDAATSWITHADLDATECLDYACGLFWFRKE